jgi:flagellar biosynthesis/type III secretory pathway M-ring protein FliF/YscJ
MTPTDAGQRPLWRRILPSAARTRIIGWVLLLVMAALGIVTFVTWRLLVSAIDARMDEALRFEVQEFNELTAPGINPRTGEPFTSVEEVISEAIAYNLARPNEKFLGYVEGRVPHPKPAGTGIHRGARR